jgi:hypothetical protein
MSFSTATWKNCTEELLAGCDALPAGVYASRQSFDLARAISAVELFSAKMDAGLVPKRPTSVEYSEISPDDVVCIADRLCALELAFYDGTSAAESVMTCLLAHEANLSALRSSDLPNAQILHAVILATLKSCSDTRVLAEYTRSFYDEEFFLGGNLGLPQPGDDVTYAQVDEALQQAAALAAQAPPQVGMACRVALARAWLEAQQHLRRFEYEQAEESLQTAAETLREVDATRVPVETALCARAFDAQVNVWRIMPQPPRPPPAETLAADVKSSSRFRAALTAGLAVCAMRRLVAPGGRLDLSAAFEALVGFANLEASTAIRVHVLAALCTPDERKLFLGLVPWGGACVCVCGASGAAATERARGAVGGRYAAERRGDVLPAVLAHVRLPGADPGLGRARGLRDVPDHVRQPRAQAAEARAPPGGVGRAAAAVRLVGRGPARAGLLHGAGDAHAAPGLFAPAGLLGRVLVRAPHDAVPGDGRGP